MGSQHEWINPRQLTTVKVVGEAGELAVLAGVGDVVGGGVCGAAAVQGIADPFPLNLQLPRRTLQVNALLCVH